MEVEGVSSRRKPSWKERENNRWRERRRRAIAANIYAGLRAHGDYKLPKHCDKNHVLMALCDEAGWTVEPDGTTYRKGCKPPSNKQDAITPTNISPIPSQDPSSTCSSCPSPIPSFQPSRSSSSFPSQSFHLSYLPKLPSFPSSLLPLRISNSAPVTPPLSSPTSKIPKQIPNWASSIDYPFFAASAPSSPGCYYHHPTIPECEESDASTVDSAQWVTSGLHYGPQLQSTFNLVKPVPCRISPAHVIEEKVKPWQGERIHEMVLDADDLELTLGSGTK